jgi:hypothetical protein
MEYDDGVGFDVHVCIVSPRIANPMLLLRGGCIVQARLLQIAGEGFRAIPEEASAHHVRTILLFDWPALQKGLLHRL